MNPNRLRLVLVVAGLALGALLLLAWTQGWFAVSLRDGTSLPVSGQQAAPALSAFGLAVLALSGALTIAGPVLRVALGVIEAGIGVAVLVTASSALADPIAASAAVITDATAVAGDESIEALVAGVAPTLFPWLAAAVAVLLVLAGAAVVVTARRWPARSRRYDSAAAPDRGAWAALDDGDDPTSR